MNEADLNYAGGVIDADGWISINATKHPSSTLGYNIRPCVGVKMKAQPNRSPTRAVIEELLGKEASVKQGTYDDMWMVQASGSTAVEAVERVLPYLRLKERQAELLLSVDWGEANHSREAFLEAAEVRDELRSMQGRHGSKYDHETFKELIQA